MGKQPWETSSQTKPPVSWNGETKTFSIVLSGLKGIGATESLEAEWVPPITYVVRLREVGTDEWSVGFETPLTGVSFVYLKPNTEYEMELRSKNAHGESAPVLARARTKPNGSIGF